MFQSWRFKIREADTAYRQGRYDEAIRLLSEQDTSGPLPGRRLVDRLVESLADRARQRLLAGDMVEAWKDYDRIVQLAGECDRATALRDELVDSVIADCRSLMLSGEFDRCLSKIDDLIRRGSGLEPVVALRETVRRVRSADKLAQRGKFAEAIEQLKSASVACEGEWKARLSDYRQRQGQGRELSEQLHRAMIQGKWTEAVAAADKLLDIAPLSSLAREARKQAWAQAGTRISNTVVAEADGTGTSSEGTKLENSGSDTCVEGHSSQIEGDGIQLTAGSAQDSSGEGAEDAPSALVELKQFFLWVDGVGGYLVCPADSITIGQAVPMAGVDVPILGDVSRRHAVIRRSGEGYVLEPIADTQLNGKLVDRPRVLLRDGDRLAMGAVELIFRQPHALSSTARLDFASRHGTQPSADSVILLADSCVMGPRKENHVVCRDWEHDVVLFRQKERLHCRAVTSFEVDGKLVDGHAVLSPDSQVGGDDFCISLEPMRD